MRETIALGFRLSAICALLVLGSGCSILYTSAARVEPAEVALDELPEDRLVEVAIEEFDPGVTAEDESDDWRETLEVRQGEARYMPFQLKQTLQDSGFWGSVWVTPGATNAAGVRVSGKILSSDGQYVGLAVKATDVTGRVWIDGNYRISLDDEAYAPGSVEPYQAVFSMIANDLLEARRDLSDEELRELQLVGELRFAEDLAADTFKGYLSESGGRTSVKRLPSRDDPMLERVRDLRDREYLFLDTLNDHYAEFHRNMAPPYRNWRRLARDEAEALSQVRRDAALRALGGAALIATAIVGIDPDSVADVLLQNVLISGGVLAGTSAYGKYQESKLNIAALKELSASFGSEVTPLVVEVDGETLRLTGNAAEQYEKWRGLLRELYEAESGLIDVYADPTRLDAPLPAVPEAETTSAPGPPLSVTE